MKGIKMVFLFRTFNKMEFSGLWNHTGFIPLAPVAQPQKFTVIMPLDVGRRDPNAIYASEYSVSISIKINLHLCF